MLKQKKFKRGKSPSFNKAIRQELLSYQRKKKAIPVPERICIPEITDSDIFLLKKTLAEKSLIEFIKQGWNVLEPNNPFADGWHLHAICEHLEAVASGQIKKLLINIPPRHCKSLAVSVFFPCWIWTRFPEKRSLFSSYSSDLSQRDGRKCLILLNSEWYRKNWMDKFTLDKETDFKIENDKRGYRIATSVGGMTTGEGGDLICFPFDEVVQTEKGKMKIGDIVENKTKVKVWSMNLQLGNPELKNIKRWVKNRASDMVQITFNDGSSIRCTPDHKIWTTNGYVMAQNLTSSDMLPCFMSKDISNGYGVDIKQSGKFSLRQRGNLVQSLKSGYIFPIFVDFCFHSKSSYCLTVEDNHNFIVSTSQGENNIVVANCTDDPHSAKEIESDVKRIAVLRWWDEVMSTRLNDQKTGVKIIIMQRLHEKDLAGHVLSKDNSYVHLCLPARYEVNGERTRTVIPFKDPRTREGEVLWEAKFADKELSSLEKELGEYARAGQLQQRPSPRGGGLFKVSNFVKKTVCDFDEVKRAVRYWDKAGTELGGCFTCGVLTFWMRDGSFFIHDVVAGQWNSSDREKHIERVVKADTYHCKRYKYSYSCWVEQEPGSAGKESALATIRRLAGYRVYADRVTGSKESRATDFAVQVEIGNVCVLDTSWTNVYFERMEFYPMGEYKDWGDASSGAFNKLIRAKLAGSWSSKGGRK